MGDVLGVPRRRMGDVLGVPGLRLEGARACSPTFGGTVDDLEPAPFNLPAGLQSTISGWNVLTL